MEKVSLRIRVVIVLVTSYALSNLLISHTEQSSFASAPIVRVQMIASDLSNSIIGVSTQIVTSLSSIHIPSLVSFSPPVSPNQPQEEGVFPSEIPYEGWTLEPTSVPPPSIPTETEDPEPVLPTTPPIPPTVKPTKTPKPTEKPSPSPTPLAPSKYLRPGKNLEDIFNIAAQTSCVPSALLKAFVAQEGPGVLTYSEHSALFYNAYDWWHRVTEKKQVCSGYGYYPETGLIAEDSLFAGERCKEAFTPETANDTVSKALGATQILQYYWEKTYKEKTKQALKVENVDRRVLLDSLVGFGIILKEGTKYSGSCDNWDFKYVIKAACVNTGGHCEYYNYCYTICKNYNKFANQNNSCDGVGNMFVPGSYCVFK